MKLRLRELAWRQQSVSLGLKPGRGLKHSGHVRPCHAAWRLARVKTRAWIETSLSSMAAINADRLARVKTRAWIETSWIPCWQRRRIVSLGLKPGRGLKPIGWTNGWNLGLSLARVKTRAWIETWTRRWPSSEPPSVSLGLKPGRGLKRHRGPGSAGCRRVSLGLKPGRGLKHGDAGDVLAALGVSLGLKPGRGLKQHQSERRAGHGVVSLGLKPGRGLKRIRR
ncbi:hypothetical protein THIX_60893 [Thiomonas sp. X19]|nr:hypothetical protein THIX_60893 [Thiomonas sp. X19]